MALGFKKIATIAGIPVFQKIIELVTGGFQLDKTGLTDGETIVAGTLMVYDEGTRKAKVVKTAEVYEAINAGTALKVKKGHLFKVGDTMDSVVIDAINTTNADYDTFTMHANVTAEAGDVLASQAVTDLSTGLLHEQVTVADNESVSIVVRGTAFARRIPPIDKSQVPATIILSQSK